MAEYLVSIGGNLKFKILAEDEAEALETVFDKIESYEKRDFFEFTRNGEQVRIEDLGENLEFSESDGEDEIYAQYFWGIE